jgi:S-adenosylmethionine:tRNA ribosyltransferase-isomerase
MKTADFDFPLPQHLIATRPLTERTGSRLLVLHRDGTTEHKHFSDLPAYLAAGDMLIMNNTKVFPARIAAFKPDGGMLEILLIRHTGDNAWEVLSRGNYTGRLSVSDELQIELLEGKNARLICQGDLMEVIWKYGAMPLPPYIKRKPDESDKKTYQTVYARNEGSIAAPTAGLHFTDALLKEIRAKGIRVRELTLHVGIGTFSPVRAKHVEDHSMDTEHFEMDKQLLSDIEETKASGKRIITVGTTTTRAIEGFASGRCVLTTLNGRLSGMTDMFIYPGYSFRVIDSLVTNFHLPGSTPLMLTSALCGWERLMQSYADAVTKGYRFLSYGDAMLIV